ncbi:unnamed protein product [Phytomonas sp. Hart1]|nr:unnamed protein product [Phytomonas sp. Hart1]|eukprot:CCW70798.1 unnamed protein product [Phytomonas sp. isolate Hart1]
MLGSVIGSTTRQKRATYVQPTTSNFHIVRVQDYVREDIISKLEVAKEDAVQSYFVPTLQTICSEQLARDFSKMPEIDTLQNKEPHLYNMILSCLTEPLNGSHTSPLLRVCVERVSDESYWKRCCMSRWSSGQLSAFLGNNEQLLNKIYGWKGLYLEHYLSDFLLYMRGKSAKRVPFSQTTFPSEGNDLNGGDIVWASEDDLQVLADLCVLCRDYVHTVELPCQFTHLNWYSQLFSMLPNVRTFRLSYGVSNIGTDYTSSMMGFTRDDAENIRKLLTVHRLEKLRLPSTRLQDAHTMAICAGLVNNKSLRVLDLSHNAIGDSSIINALAVLLSQPDFPLEALYLGDNNITGEGARALAEALEVNKSLRILYLDQNRIPDENAGDLFVRTLVNASLLQELHLGYNVLGVSTATALIEVLPQLQTLRWLNIAGNYRLGGGYSEKNIEDLIGIETLLTSGSSHPDANMPPMDKANSAQEPCESENEEVKEDHEDEEHVLETENMDDGFVSVLSLSDKDPDGKENNTQQNKDENTEVAAPSVRCMKISVTGSKLLKSIYDNTSLTYIDVRRCGFTLNEEHAIEKVVRSRPSGK